jgi:hypothetical protein
MSRDLENGITFEEIFEVYLLEFLYDNVVVRIIGASPRKLCKTEKCPQSWLEKEHEKPGNSPAVDLRKRVLIAFYPPPCPVNQPSVLGCSHQPRILSPRYRGCDRFGSMTINIDAQKMDEIHHSASQLIPVIQLDQNLRTKHPDLGFWILPDL